VLPHGQQVDARFTNPLPKRGRVPRTRANAKTIGDTAKGQTFYCEHCGATHTFKNLQLLRLFLTAIERGDLKVRLALAAEPK
jgi:hypothetical protein